MTDMTDHQKRASTALDDADDARNDRDIRIHQVEAIMYALFDVADAIRDGSPNTAQEPPLRKVDEESNLVQHARTELELIPEDPETITGLLAVIHAFADMDHSGVSASVVIPMIHELLQFKNLTPLHTIADKPDEWIDHSELSGAPLWQNCRNSTIFSDDGTTYYSVESVPRVYSSNPNDVVSDTAQETLESVWQPEPGESDGGEAAGAPQDDTGRTSHECAWEECASAADLAEAWHRAERAEAARDAVVHDIGRTMAAEALNAHVWRALSGILDRAPARLSADVQRVTCADCSAPLPYSPEWRREPYGVKDFRCDGCVRAVAWKGHAEKAEADKKAILTELWGAHKAHLADDAPLDTAVIDIIIRHSTKGDQ